MDRVGFKPTTSDTNKCNILWKWHIDSSKHYRYYQLYNQRDCDHFTYDAHCSSKGDLTAEQGETATAIFCEIAKFHAETPGEGKGLTMALIHTDSTGTLAALNGTIIAGIADMQPNGETSVTLWEWESGIGNNGGVGASAAT